MKALQKNQGRTDQMFGAMADVLTSIAMPNQQWVSCMHENIMPQIQDQKQQTHADVFLRACRA